MAEPAADLVTDHSVSDCFRYDEADACRGGLRRLLEEQMNYDSATSGPATTTDRCGEIRATPQSLRRGQHDYLDIPA
jgi:hypothetical protein